MTRHLFALGIGLCLTGCSQNTDCNPICHQKTKPNVAFIPVVESVACCDWDLGKELTNETVEELASKNTVYLTPYIQFKSALDSTGDCDYFSSDLNFANYFGSSDFLVVSELLRHEVVPFSTLTKNDGDGKKNIAQMQVLDLGTRVRVLDLRYEQPKVILQKFVDTREIISGNESKIDYSELNPENELYAVTPLGRGHKKIARELSKEIESAILGNW